MRFFLALVILAAVALGGAWYGGYWDGNPSTLIRSAGLMQVASTADRASDGVEVAQLGTGEGQGKVERLVIGIDISASNPLVDSDAFAARVAERVAPRIAALGFRSQVMIRTFGSYGQGYEQFAADVTISSREPAEAVAASIGRIIAGMPESVRSGRRKAQPNTNIVAFLENIAQVVACADMPTTVILATDGIEDSEIVDLTRRNAVLPPPPRAWFQGCTELQMLGLGQGRDSPQLTTHLREQWEAWAKAAGFERYAGLNDW